MDEQLNNVEGLILPRTETEQVLYDLWKKVLKVPALSVTDHFVSLGGDSLAAVELLFALEESFEIYDWEVEEMYELPTVEIMAKKVDDYLAQTAGGTVAATKETVEAKLSIREWALQNGFVGKAEYELSRNQRGHWFMQQMDPSSTTYNERYPVKMKGNLDHAKWEQSLRDLIKRHPSMRTLFVERDGLPKQIVHDDLAYDLAVIDAGNLSEEEAEKFARKALADDMQTPFDLAKGPLYRFKTFKTGESTYYFYVVVHHIVFDGVSAETFYRDLSAIYTANVKGEPCDLAPLELEYGQFAEWQLAQIDTPEFRKVEEHWVNSLAKPLPVLELPIDLPRPARNSNQGANIVHPLSAELIQDLQRVCERTNASMYVVMLSAYYAWLYTQTNQKDLIVGMSLNGRTEQEQRDLIGNFINTMPVRVNLDGLVSFRDVVNHVRKRLSEATANQAYPFDLLVEKVNPDRDPSRPVLYSTMFDAVPMNLVVADLEVEPLYGDKTDAQTDLTWNLFRSGKQFVFEVIYNVTLFHAETVQRFISQYENILHAVVKDTDTSLVTLKKLSTEVDLDELF